MGFFGSGDKTSTSLDNRVGASDNATVLQNGSLLFAPQSPLPNSVAATVAQKVDWTTIAIVGAVVVVVVVIINVLFNRKT